MRFFTLMLVGCFLFAPRSAHAAAPIDFSWIQSPVAIDVIDERSRPTFSEQWKVLTRTLAESVLRENGVAMNTTSAYSAQIVLKGFEQRVVAGATRACAKIWVRWVPAGQGFLPGGTVIERCYAEASDGPFSPSLSFPGASGLLSELLRVPAIAALAGGAAGVVSAVDSIAQLHNRERYPGEQEVFALALSDSLLWLSKHPFPKALPAEALSRN